MKQGAALALALIVCGCGNRLQTREAVERGVRKGVAQRGVNVEAMDVNVASVKFHGDRADAVVAFAPKGGKISDGLTMQYQLEQRDNEWVITGRSQTSGAEHGRDMRAPATTDPRAGAENQAGNPLPDPELARPLPPGHPALNGNEK